MVDPHPDVRRGVVSLVEGGDASQRDEGGQGHGGDAEPCRVVEEVVGLDPDKQVEEEFLKDATGYQISFPFSLSFFLSLSFPLAFPFPFL